MPKKYARRESCDKPKPTNTLSPNRYQLLEPTSENIELVSENIQNTDALPLSGNENELNRTKMYLLLKILETKDLQYLLINTQKDKLTFHGFLLSLVPNYLVKLLYYQKVKETF